VVGGLDILNVTVNHKDKNKSHNYFDNLEPMTHSVNVKYSNSGEGNPMAKLSNAQRQEIRDKYRPYVNGLVIELAREYGVSRRNIRKIVKG
jgi:hypothetical protein